MADAFRRFVERSAAGSADQLQLMYGTGGERRLTEHVLDHLEGYRGASPVRVGNTAVAQLQLDMYGELLELTWRWHERGNSPDDDYWRFLLELVEVAAERWSGPDSGLWEMRGEPRHFVHSKVMCWATLDKGLRLAEECMRKAPERRWKKVRDEIREAVEAQGYDEKRGVFTQSFGSNDLDAALLLLPRVGFVDYRDERMLRTTDAVREDLDDDGLLKRYRTGGGEAEGAFLACSFWLAECLAHQERLEDARGVFDRTLATGNDLGLRQPYLDGDPLSLRASQGDLPVHALDQLLADGQPQAEPLRVAAPVEPLENVRQALLAYPGPLVLHGDERPLRAQPDATACFGVLHGVADEHEQRLLQPLLVGPHRPSFSFGGEIQARASRLRSLRSLNRRLTVPLTSPVAIPSPSSPTPSPAPWPAWTVRNPTSRRAGAA